MSAIFGSRLPLFLASLSLALPLSPLLADLPAAIADSPISPAIAENSPIVAQGTGIRLNGKQFPAAWVQWQQGASPRIGISDTAAMQLLGLELLNTDRPNVQPSRWFSGTETEQKIGRAHV